MDFSLLSSQKLLAQQVAAGGVPLRSQNRWPKKRFT